MAAVQQQPTQTVRASQSAVRSHVSYRPDIAGVCHHSGQYLKDDELQTAPIDFLRETHEFPGLPGLDRRFASLSHAAEHLHWSWSRPTVQGLSLGLGGGALLYLAYRIWPQQIYASAGWMVWVFGAVVALLALAGLALIGWGVWLVGNREALFHADATRTQMGPATADYPIDATYRLWAMETVRVDLHTSGDLPPTVADQECAVRVELFPLVNEAVEPYARFREQYVTHPVGQFVYAGVVAPDNLWGVTFDPAVVEFDHRIVLRRPAAEIGIAQARSCPEFEVVAPYRLDPDTLLVQHGATAHFPLHCEARIDPYNSRILELRWIWNRGGVRQLRLETCTLAIPAALGKVVGVAQGRVAHDQTGVIWSKRLFQQSGERHELVLRIEYQQAVLTTLEPITGDYVIDLDGLLSSLTLDADHVWNAHGRPVTATDCIVRQRSQIYGRLTVDPQRLAAEHEYVQKTDQVRLAVEPDDRVVDGILAVLIEEGFTVQRIAQAEPRKNLKGALPSDLVYWDIFGRYYAPGYLDPIDVHVVLSGIAAAAEPGSGVAVQPLSEVSLHLRALHDPRNTQLPALLDKIVGAGDTALAAKIERRLTPLAAHES